MYVSGHGLRLPRVLLGHHVAHSGHRLWCHAHAHAMHMPCTCHACMLSCTCCHAPCCHAHAAMHMPCKRHAHAVMHMPPCITSQAFPFSACGSSPSRLTTRGSLITTRSWRCNALNSHPPPEKPPHLAPPHRYSAFHPCILLDYLPGTLIAQPLFDLSVVCYQARSTFCISCAVTLSTF